MTEEIDKLLAPDLLVRCVRQVANKLPAHYALALPSTIAHGLILRRLAVPVADFSAAPDAVIDCEWTDLEGVTN